MISSNCNCSSIEFVILRRFSLFTQHNLRVMPSKFTYKIYNTYKHNNCEIYGSDCTYVFIVCPNFRTLAYTIEQIYACMYLCTCSHTLGIVLHIICSIDFAEESGARLYLFGIVLPRLLHACIREEFNRGVLSSAKRYLF